MLIAVGRTVKWRRRKWEVLAIDFLRGCERPHAAPLAGGRLEENFAAHDFNRVAADTHVNYPVMAVRGAHKNPAGPLHLHTLFNENALIGLGDAMGHHPGGGTTRGGAGRRVLAVVERHAGVQAGLAIDGLAGYEIKRLARGLGEILGGTVEI